MTTNYFTHFFSIILFASIAQANLVKYENEQEMMTKTASFKISAGWSYDKDLGKIVSPEGDLIAYLF